MATPRIQPGPRRAYTNAKAVTPNDNTDLPDGPCTGLFVGGAGNLVVIMSADDTNTAVTLPVVAGTYLHGLCVKRVKVSTATGIVALY